MKCPECSFEWDHEKSTGSKSFDAYAKAYELRYGVPPVRNLQINSLFKQLAARLGEDAPFVAEFYLSHSDAFYKRHMHPVKVLLRDCEKLRTEWVTGNKMSASLAKSEESKDHYIDQMNRVKKGILK